MLVETASISLIVTFFLINLHFVIGPENPTPELTTNSNGILPIIFIKHNGKYLYPTDVKQNIYGNRLSFTSKRRKRERFFCPAETPEQKKNIEVGLNLSQVYPNLHKFHKYIKNNHPEYKEYLAYLEFSKYCLFKKTFNPGEPQTCLTEPAFAIRKIIRIGDRGKKEVERCGPNNAGIMYEFFYLACPRPTLLNKWHITSLGMYLKSDDFKNYINKLPFMTVKHVAYRFCYDHQTEDTIFTSHRLRSNNLLFDDVTKYDREKRYEMTTDDYGFFDKNHFETLKNIYGKVDLFEETSNVEYSDNDENVSAESLKYKGHQLVSRTNFSTALWRKPTYHYLNVKPMHEKLFPLWDYIEEVILDHFRTLKIKLVIYTGAFTTKSKEERTAEYINENQIQIPDTWIKLIYEFDKTRDYCYGTAITMHNYIVDKDPCPNSKKLCEVIIYGSTLLKNFPKALDHICCETVNATHLKLFNLQLEAHSPLVIGSSHYREKIAKNKNSESDSTSTENKEPQSV